MEDFEFEIFGNVETCKVKGTFCRYRQKLECIFYFSTSIDAKFCRFSYGFLYPRILNCYKSTEDILVNSYYTGYLLPKLSHNRG